MSSQPVNNKVTEQVKTSLAKRYRKEKIFRFFGLTSVAIGFMVVVILLSDIFIKAVPAFTQHWVKLDIEYSQQWLEIDAVDEKSLQQANYRNVLKNSFYGMFEDVKERRDRRLLFKLISSNAEFTVKDTLVETPDLLGQSTSVWVLLDDDVDTWLKSDRDGAQNGRMSALQMQWMGQLIADDKVESRFNSGLFTNSDSREPELAGVAGSIKGTLLTMLVTLVLSFPLGVAAAVYLEEFAPQNKFTDMIEININNLAAVPSIVFGLLGLAVIINLFGLPRFCTFGWRYSLDPDDVTDHYYCQPGFHQGGAAFYP